MELRETRGKPRKKLSCFLWRLFIFPLPTLHFLFFSNLFSFQTSLRNEKRSNPNTILFLPIRSRTKASQPTVEQILDVCHEYIISVALEVPQRDVIAETFTNLLDVLNRCTWKLRDEIFVFLDKVVNMFPSNVYVENHVLFRVFLQASLCKLKYY